MSSLERWFEIFIQVLIVYSIGSYVVEMELADSRQHYEFFLWSERIIAAIFTVEYIARWIASGRWSYPLEFAALIDLAAVLPFYLTFFVDLRSLRLIRLLRSLRLFRLTRYNNAMQQIFNAYHRVRYEFAVVGFALLIVWWISSLAMYELERDSQPEDFARLSDSMWYVLVTVTTVGYGDKTPLTIGGKLVASATMLCGLALCGTFLSLIGSAYLEEIRRAYGQEDAAEDQDDSATQGAADCAATQDFDADLVLERIDRGELSAPSGRIHLETLQLLTLACQKLLGRESGE